MSIESILWLLPIVFMLHDLEELIFIKWWLSRNKTTLLTRYPRLAPFVISHLDSLSTQALALVVAEEFLLLSLFTLLAVEYQLYGAFAGFVAVYLLHLALHSFKAILMRQYVPATITAVLTAPYGVYALAQLGERGLIHGSEVLFWGVWAGTFALANLALAHFLARKFERWLRRPRA